MSRVKQTAKTKYRKVGGLDASRPVFNRSSGMRIPKGRLLVFVLLYVSGWFVFYWYWRLHNFLRSFTSPEMEHNSFWIVFAAVNVFMFLVVRSMYRPETIKRFVLCTLLLLLSATVAEYLYVISSILSHYVPRDPANAAVFLREVRVSTFIGILVRDFIIFSLMQYSYQGQSLNLASIVQKHYTQNLPMGNRGVKQAGFLVLWYATMPSILTELGFISNPQDRKILTTKNGQEKLARSLFNAFSEYKVKSEGKGKLIVLPEESVEEDASEPSTASAAISEEARSEAPICYRVQVMSSPKKVPRNSSRFGTYRGQVKEIVIAGNYKYFVGEVASYREALSLQSEVRKQSRDAFVVAFEGERTISVQEARQRE